MKHVVLFQFKMDACPICCDSLANGIPKVCLKEKGSRGINYASNF